MKKIIIFLSLILFNFTLNSQVLAPAADGHILRNETYMFDQQNPTHTYPGATTYFVYFQDLYVGGEDTFTGDFDPNDGKATHYNRELRAILEFDISSLNLSPNTFSAFLKVTTDGNFWPTEPTLIVEAYDQLEAEQNGVITKNDYSSGTQLQDFQTIDAQNFNKTYSFNVTGALNSDILNGRDFSGFVLIPNPRNGNEVSFVSTYEDPSGTKAPKLEITSLQPDISVSLPYTCVTIVNEPINIIITVINLGQGVLNISSVQEIQDSFNFYNLDLTGFQYSLNPQESTTFTINFNPQSVGSFPATFRISSNDPDENPYDFTLNCEGTSAGVPSIEVETSTCENIPTFLDYPVSIKVKNSGTDTLVISSIQEIQDNFGVFEIDLTGLSYQIPPSNFTTFNVIFSPTAPGSYSGIFRIFSNDPQKPQYDFNLNCSSVSSTAPDIEVNPEEIYWNNTKINETYTQIITIKNKSTNPDGILNISSISLSGDSVFSTDTSELKSSLKPGEQTSLKIILSSNTTGIFKATVTINSNDPNTPTVLVNIFAAVSLNGIQQNTVSSNQGYIIPASALAWGAYGSRWVTDVKIFNSSEAKVTFKVYFLPTQSNNTSALSADFDLEISQTLSIPNILKVLFGLDNGVGAILITPIKVDSKLLITSRTYNLTDQGTYGQFIKGFSVREFKLEGEKCYLLGLQKDSRMRTNVGFNSLSEGANLKISLYKGDGTFLASKEKTLYANSHLQINDIFAELGVEGNSNSYAIVEVLSGSVFSYASVVNNQSNDPVFVQMY